MSPETKKFGKQIAQKQQRGKQIIIVFLAVNQYVESKSFP
jgi:hypothetical protein